MSFTVITRANFDHLQFARSRSSRSYHLVGRCRLISTSVVEGLTYETMLWKGRRAQSSRATSGSNFYVVVPNAVCMNLLSFVTAGRERGNEQSLPQRTNGRRQ